MLNFSTPPMIAPMIMPLRNWRNSSEMARASRRTSALTPMMSRYVWGAVSGENQVGSTAPPGPR